ncbi:MAG TPA: hypothetical protein H9962_05440 [Candidatus Mailhella merdigallinarum]|uniref:ABC-type transport auxiliary lipoprotein component domain-containing protein n=1 Tax=Candidatus Mailhella merdigallinarum TaxID=2838658 RepID=A0A9D2HEC2_9BACT|nr:hypothetical protein [Desulfovibrionaceae bacterium]PWM71355.1 MAG: hypothetical protein DBX67_00885 [Desulfovibrionaceae bacterium]HJA08616.1 hypothetical protein [Candidatus Mailhella merdigallinarum]
MSTFPRLFSGLCAALLCALTLAGCAPKDTVRLLYTPVTPSVLPAPTAPRVAVVLFEDKRGKQEIGTRSKGGVFSAATSVPEWISRSLADEISRMGPQVSYAPSIQLAQSARPDYIVTGTVEEVWVKESNPTTYAATVRISFNVANRQGSVYSQNLSSSQEKTGLPSSGMVEDLLTGTLREVLGVAASKINEATH